MIKVFIKLNMVRSYSNIGYEFSLIAGSSLETYTPTYRSDTDKGWINYSGTVKDICIG